MFLLALTRTSLNVASFLDAGLFAQEDKAAVSGFHLTIITDTRTGRATKTDRGWQIFESMAPETGADSCLVFCRLRVDAASKIIEVSRPLMGGLPVYHHTNAAGEVFCSSHISLLRRAGVALYENRGSLPEFFVYRCVMPPRTLFKDIEQVPGGATVRLRLVDRRWRAADPEYPLLPSMRPLNRADGIDALSRQMLELLEEAISRLSPRKDNLAVLLSGGLDSSVIWNICHRVYGINGSYSAGFSFEAVGANLEKEYALSAAAAFGSAHTYFEPTADEYARGLVESIAAAEVPVHHLQSVLLYLLFKDALPRAAQVVLTGEGADSLFGSEELMPVFHQERRLFSLRENPVTSRILSAAPVFVLLRSLLALIGRGGQFWSTFAAASQRNLPLDDPRQLIWSSHRYGSQQWVCQHFGVKYEDIIAGRYAALHSFEGRSFYDIWVANDLLGGSTITNSIWSSLGDACGKTLYSPFVVPEVMNFAMAAPWPVKLQSPKHVLRGVARLIGIPEGIVARPKSGFGVSMERWAGREGVFKPLVHLAEELFGIDEVRAVQVPAQDRAWIFWGMLNYAIWRRVIVDGEPVQRLLDRLGLTNVTAT